MNPEHGGHVETETTLVIRARNPREIVKRLAKISRLAGTQMRPRADLVFRDIYLLPPEGGPRFALRVRDFGKNLLVAFKGSAKKTRWGALQRMEVETCWHERGMLAIARAIETAGYALPSEISYLSNISPVDLLASWGFVPVQDRETLRLVRDILIHTEASGDQIVGELVIDSVIYHFSERDVPHFELEVEEKHPGYSEHLARVVEELEMRRDFCLERWFVDKLVMGIVLEQLLKRGMDLTHEDGTLQPSAYDEILHAVEEGFLMTRITSARVNPDRGNADR